MSYITRADGEHFVVPSYRDILTAKQKMQLKRNIISLSQNYGSYVSLQRKGEVYEVTFSTDRGYLLGESIWAALSRPLDMIYCERVKGTDDAILVVVKAGSVYLDGRYSLEGVLEEIIILQTQQNKYEVFVHGDVPVNTDTLNADVIKRFHILETAVFPTVPLIKSFQLQPVEQALKNARIGAIPTQTILFALTLIAISWWFFSANKTQPVQTTQIKPIDVYADYYDALMSPTVEDQINALSHDLKMLSHLSGWQLNELHYSNQQISADVISLGSKVADLNTWAKANNFTMEIGHNGFLLLNKSDLTNRTKTKNIFYIKSVLAELVDRLQVVYPGNNLTIAETVNKPYYKILQVVLHIDKLNPLAMKMIGKQFSGLPSVFKSADLKLNDDQTYSGTINVEIVGD